MSVENLIRDEDLMALAKRIAAYDQMVDAMQTTDNDIGEQQT